MKNKNVLVLGSTGFIGRSITKRLLADENRLICPVRNASRVKRNILSGDIGQIEIIDFDLNDLSNLEDMIKKSDYIINLIGLLFEKSNMSFELAHYLLPKKIATFADKYNKPFLHISSLGSTYQTKSNYLISKKMGEEFIENNNNNHIILRPSIVYGEEDNFINQFGKMAKLLPFLPLFRKGQTKFQPIYVNDLSLMILKLLQNFDDHKNSNIPAVGNEVFSFKEILTHILNTLNKPIRFISIPSFFAIILGKNMQFLPNPPFTYDQFLSLAHDSISDGDQEFVCKLIGRDLSNMKTITALYLDKFIDRV